MPDYKITIAGQKPFPVTAPNPSTARNWAVRDRVIVEALTTREAMQFGRDGVDIIDIGADPEASAPELVPEGDMGDGGEKDETGEGTPIDPGEAGKAVADAAEGDGPTLSRSKPKTDEE